MEKTLLSPDEVLERIGAESFWNVSKDKLIAFVSTLPEMDGVAGWALAVGGALLGVRFIGKKQ